MEKEQDSGQRSTSAAELLHLRGSRPLFGEELRTRVAAGARCVRFEYCFSLLFVTVRRQSPVYLTSSWQERYLRGLWFSFVAILLGPWGVPWGLLWSSWAVWVNTTGGADCTQEVLSRLVATGTDYPVEHPASSGEAVYPL